MNKEQRNTIFLFFSLFCFLLGNSINAQNTFSEIENLKLFSLENEIVNGEMWVNQKKFEGHPYWNENMWYTGYVIYKGKKFENIAIRYDIYNNDVLVFKKINDKGRALKLNKQYLQGFTIFDPTKTDTITFDIISFPEIGEPGIYARAYEGKSSYYIQYIKTVNNKISNNYTGEYLLEPRLFATNNGQFLEFTSKSGFLELFAEKQSEVKKFMRQNRIKFQRKTPDSLTPVFQYYDSLNKVSIEN